MVVKKRPMLSERLLRARTTVASSDGDPTKYRCLNLKAISASNMSTAFTVPEQPSACSARTDRRKPSISIPSSANAYILCGILDSIFKKTYTLILLLVAEEILVARLSRAYSDAFWIVIAYVDLARAEILVEKAHAARG